MIDFTKPVTTRDGRQVRILCIDGPDQNPVIGLIEGAFLPSAWALNGQFCYNNQSMMDLINPPQKEVLYMNIYPSTNYICLHETREIADRIADKSRIACIRIEFTPGQFDE